MIPADFIVQWRAHARWSTDEQIEQDLVLSRALAAIFGDAELAAAVALRVGTALHKLHLAPARRYSEDIDLVQLRPEPIGPTIDRLRRQLDSWLGVPGRQQGEGVRLVYRFDSELPPVVRLRLKVETNTREHAAVHRTIRLPWSVQSRWWSGQAEINTFPVEELLGTKLRALFQRQKGRDLFDLWLGLELGADPEAVVASFLRYTQLGGHRITRARFEQNLAAKTGSPAFTDDVPRLLPVGVTFAVAEAAQRVGQELIARLPGRPWQGNPS